MPVSRTANWTRNRRRRRAARQPTRQHDLAALGELHRVAEQVDRIWRSRVDVADERAGHLRRRARRRARGPSRRPRGATSSSADSTHSRRSNGARSRSSRPASILEKSRMSLMMASSASPLAGSSRRSRAARASSSRVEQQPGHADDGVHRRADLVAHGGQERALGLRGRLGLAPRLLQLADVVVDGVDPGLARRRRRSRRSARGRRRGTRPCGCAA